jgi:hypothetical protein
MELRKNAESGDYYVYAAPQRRNYRLIAEESLIDKRGHSKSPTGIADPYGLITRWKTRTESSSAELLASNP